MICYHCKETLPDDATHCYYCGADLRHNDLDDTESFDDLLGPLPTTRGYDYVDSLEPAGQRTLKIGLSIAAVVLLLLVAVYLVSRLTAKSPNDVAPSLAKLDANLSLSVITNPSPAPTAPPTTATEAPVSSFTPPTSPSMPVVTAPSSPVASVAPLPAQGGSRTYTVKAGDSYWSLAKAFYGDGSLIGAKKIASANGKTISDPLSVGQSIVIPDVSADGGATPTGAKPPAPNATAGGTTYVVKAGDTYWSVARACYGQRVTAAKVKAIARANGRTINDPLKVGETLAIPPG